MRRANAAKLTFCRLFLLPVLRYTRAMIRVLSSLLFALLLAVSSVPAALMHNQMQGSSQMVVCSDTPDASGLITVTLDATGQPISAPHHCPQCLAALDLALLPSTPTAAAPIGQSQPLNRPVVLLSASSQSPTASARDPPAFA